jgi:hypothetical protein
MKLFDIILAKWLAASALIGLTVGCAPNGDAESLRIEPEPSADELRLAVSAAPANYTFGHADIRFAVLFDQAAPFFEVSLVTDGATVDGVPGVSTELPIEAVNISTDVEFLRPSPDAGFLHRSAYRKAKGCSGCLKTTLRQRRSAHRSWVSITRHRRVSS